MLLKICFCLSIISQIEGCLITNCPKGGKRSVSPLPMLHRFRTPMTGISGECRGCGPNQEGRCIGRNICCGPKIGCLVGTPGILSQCAGASDVSGPSIVLPRGKPCSIGVCLSDAVCCSTDACKLDMSCEMETNTDMCPISEQSSY